ncbi:MAG: hypothetical protein IJ062_01960 [Firmicutes bacterium]|nr:hypothetical protein [Bacillota bacterium]
MSNLSLFLKGNKKQRENTKYAATRSLCDENGEPLLWTIKPLTTKESEEIRESCTYEVPVKGKANVYHTKIDTSKYLVKLAIASIAEPNLYSAELQDSYGVRTPEELLLAMIDDPKEYSALLEYINSQNDNEGMQDKIDKAKN